MTVTLELPDDLEQEFVIEAGRRGLSLNDYLLGLLLASSEGAPSVVDGSSLVDYWRREGLIGVRPEIEDSVKEARRIRQVAEQRREVEE